VRRDKTDKVKRTEQADDASFIRPSDQVTYWKALAAFLMLKKRGAWKYLDRLQIGPCPFPPEAIERYLREIEAFQREEFKDPTLAAAGESLAKFARSRGGDLFDLRTLREIATALQDLRMVAASNREALEELIKEPQSPLPPSDDDLVASIETMLDDPMYRNHFACRDVFGLPNWRLSSARDLALIKKYLTDNGVKQPKPSDLKRLSDFANKLSLNIPEPTLQRLTTYTGRPESVAAMHQLASLRRGKGDLEYPSPEPASIAFKEGAQILVAADAYKKLSEILAAMAQEDPMRPTLKRNLNRWPLHASETWKDFRLG
jgi:hypothetical protein